MITFPKLATIFVLKGFYKGLKNRVKYLKHYFFKKDPLSLCPLKKFFVFVLLLLEIIMINKTFTCVRKN